MSLVSRGVLFAVAAVVASGSTRPARAEHTVFDYAVERFEADGNLYGSADGAFDLIDEFDDGVVGPTFHHYFGTVTEEGGAMHLKSPGTHFSLNFPWTLDQSDALSNAAVVQEGQGNGVYRTTWRLDGIGVNHYLHMTLWAGSEIVGLALTNFDDSIGSLYSPPYPTGYQITAHHERFENFEIHGVSLEHQALDSVTGAMVFELDYDDATRTVRGRFSVDGGATFHEGFAPMSIGFTPGAGAGALLIVGADPYEANSPVPPGCPVPLLLRKAIVDHAGVPGRGRIGIDAAVGDDRLDPPNQGVRLTLVDFAAAGGQILWDVTIPSGPPGSGCGPRDGWIVRRGRGLYRNASGAVPPLCAPGSAAGVRKVKTTPAAVDVRVAARGLTLPAAYGPIAFAYGNPATPPAECAEWLSSGVGCTARGSRLLCR